MLLTAILAPVDVLLRCSSGRLPRRRAVRSSTITRAIQAHARTSMLQSARPGSKRCFRQLLRLGGPEESRLLFAIQLWSHRWRGSSLHARAAMLHLRTVDSPNTTKERTALK